MLQHLLPALLPSWRFFDHIGPAPRLEWACTATSFEAVPEQAWREFRPPPARRSLAQVLLSLVWAPRRNETLYVLRCAERVMDEPSARAERTLLRALQALDARGEWPGMPRGRVLHVRILALSSDAGALHQGEVWRSQCSPFGESETHVPS